MTDLGYMRLYGGHRSKFVSADLGCCGYRLNAGPVCDESAAKGSLRANAALYNTSYAPKTGTGGSRPINVFSTILSPNFDVSSHSPVRSRSEGTEERKRTGGKE